MSPPIAWTPITTAVLPPLPAASSASAPSKRSCSERVDQPLAICGHTKPLTPPRLQNATSAARQSRSSLLSAVNGVSPMGKRPDNCLLPAVVVASTVREIGSETANAPDDCRNDRLFISVSPWLPSIDALPPSPAQLRSPHYSNSDHAQKIATGLTGPPVAPGTR